VIATDRAFATEERSWQSKGSTALQNPDQDHDQDHDEKKVDEAPAKRGDERTKEPEDYKDQDDRFERVPRHGDLHVRE